MNVRTNAGSLIGSRIYGLCVVVGVYILNCGACAYGRNKKLKNQLKVITQTFQATNHVEGAEFKVEPVEDVQQHL